MYLYYYSTKVVLFLIFIVLFSFYIPAIQFFYQSYDSVFVEIQHLLNIPEYFNSILVVIFFFVGYTYYTYLHILTLYSFLFVNLNIYPLINDFLIFKYNFLLLNSVNQIHPLLLLLGLVYLVFFIVDFFKLNLSNNLITWLLFFKNITVFALILGSFWAFQEGGWGGWWVWELSEMLLIFLIIFYVFILHISYENNNLQIFKWFLLINLSLYIATQVSIKYIFINSLHSFFSEKNFYLLNFKILTLPFLLFLCLYRLFHKVRLFSRYKIGGECFVAVFYVLFYSYLLFFNVNLVLISLLNIVSLFYIFFLKVPLYRKYFYHLGLYSIALVFYLNWFNSFLFSSQAIELAFNYTIWNFVPSKLSILYHIKIDSLTFWNKFMVGSFFIFGKLSSLLGINFYIFVFDYLVAVCSFESFLILPFLVWNLV